MNTPPTPSTAAQPVEQGDPAVDGRAFRRCLGQFATGVTVVTTRMADELAGMAVNSFAAVSLDPPLVLWSIRRESRSARVFMASGYFAVNVLAANQVEVSQRFGAGHPDRFTATRWTAGHQGLPLIGGALAQLECRRVAVHEGGDHLIVVGHVERYARFAGEPLLFSQGQYAVAEAHPVAAQAAAAPAPTQREESFLTLLSRTNQQMSEQFQTHRQSLGLTPSTTRVLRRLVEGECGIDELERSTYLGRLSIEDALQHLMDRGHIVGMGNERFAATASGLATSEAVARLATSFTSEKLRGVDERDIAAARRVFVQLRSR